MSGEHHSSILSEFCAAVIGGHTSTLSMEKKLDMVRMRLPSSKGDGKVWSGTVVTSLSLHAHTGSVAMLARGPTNIG